MSGFIQPSYFTNGTNNPYGFINPVYITNYNDFKYTIGAGLNDTDNTLSTVGNPAIQLTSNSLFANDNLVSIQSQIDVANQADVIYVSAGSYSERMVINNKYNMAITAPYVGNSICEVLNGLEITGTSEIIRLSNIQFEGTGSVINGQGRHFLNRVSFQGVLGTINTLTISGFGAGKFMTLENCEFDNYCAITVANTFAGVLFFINCNFGGASITLSQFSNQQVIFNNCAGFTSFPSSTRATFFGMNVLTTGESRNTASTLDSPFFLIGGTSTSSSLNQCLTTDGVAGLKLTPVGGVNGCSLTYQDATQQPINNSVDSLITLYTSTSYAITRNLRQLLNCLFNFSTSGGTAVLTFTLYDITDGEGNEIEIQDFSQTINNNIHHSIPINFNWVQPDGRDTIQFRIDMFVSASGSASTDASDYVSIQQYTIQPAS